MVTGYAKIEGWRHIENILQASWRQPGLTDKGRLGASRAFLSLGGVTLNCSCLAVTYGFSLKSLGNVLLKLPKIVLG